MTSRDTTFALPLRHTTSDPQNLAKHPTTLSADTIKGTTLSMNEQAHSRLVTAARAMSELIAALHSARQKRMPREQKRYDAPCR